MLSFMVCFLQNFPFTISKCLLTLNKIVIWPNICQPQNVRHPQFSAKKLSEPASIEIRYNYRWAITIRQRAKHGIFDPYRLGGIAFMSEFEAEVKKAEKELEQGLMTTDSEPFNETAGTDEFLGDIKAQAQEYGQKLQEAGRKAYDFAHDKFDRAGDKFKELSNKDPKELIDDAKEFARQKPGQTILISAAVGLVLGLLLRGGRK